MAIKSVEYMNKKNPYGMGATMALFHKDFYFGGELWMKFATLSILSPGSVSSRCR